MEEQVQANCEHILNQAANNVSENTPSLVALSSARSLIVNPSTSEHTISSIFETLARSLQPPHHNPLSLHHTLSLLSDLALHHPHLSHRIFNTVRSSSLLCEHIPTRTIAQALSVLISIAESDQTLLPSISEGFFVSLCFRPCVSVRHWLLLNAERLNVPPQFLLTLFLGFTKDPYPYVRRVALDGLVGLCKSILVENHGLIEGCYCRAVELLSDTEDCVRCAAVCVVSVWGQLLVASSQDKNKRDWSDALFLQLCSMVRDMSLEVRVKAFDALGLIEMVSENILLQTLSKKVLAITKENKDLRQYSAKLFELPLSSAAGAFIHGLEDEFYEVRRSACHSLRTLTILSADFAGEALNIVIDVLNDDSLAVRAEALETMHHMAIYNLLKVQETHMPMFLGTLFDNNALVRSAVRRVLRSMKLQDLAIFKLSVYGLLENLEMYPQDEADVFSVLFSTGRHHGSFAVSIIEEVYDEIGPSCEGKLGFDSARVAALLVLGISVPLSSDQHICSIPPILFSYAVTLLGRISRALCDVVDQNTLLAYLSHCSRSKDFSAAEFYFKEEEPFLHVVESGVGNNTDAAIVSPAGIHLQQLGEGASEIHYWKTWKPRNIATSPVDYQLENHEVTKSVKFIFSKVEDLWQLIQFGYTDEVLKMLRSWKEELATFTVGPFASAVFFTLQYLRFMKQLARTWVHFVFPRKHCSHGIGDLALVLAKLDRSLKEMKYRFIGLSKEEELHVLELILLYCTLRLSSVEACFNGTALKKLYSTISQDAEKVLPHKQKSCATQLICIHVII
ncbi:protein SIEL isoform X3 [Cornus florida]|uniref:protein SIEL isoform X3 n=1 Tax=Cornus florida TaxID=4283 RepID=UPI0028A0380A|nr:protein SIEL isoform X3 [Cornus florida]